MTYKILQTVPICPSCQALMIKRYTDKTYFVCADCKKILEVVEPGKAENELIVTDGEKEKPEKETLKICSRCNEAICVSPLQHLFSCPYHYLNPGETEGCEHFEERIDK